MRAILQRNCDYENAGEYCEKTFVGHKLGSFCFDVEMKFLE